VLAWYEARDSIRVFASRTPPVCIFICIYCDGVPETSRDPDSTRSRSGTTSAAPEPGRRASSRGQLSSTGTIDSEVTLRALRSVLSADFRAHANPDRSEGVACTTQGATLCPRLGRERVGKTCRLEPIRGRLAPEIAVERARARFPCCITGVIRRTEERPGAADEPRPHPSIAKRGLNTCVTYSTLHCIENRATTHPDPRGLPYSGGPSRIAPGGLFDAQSQYRLAGFGFRAPMPRELPFGRSYIRR
jgi:hypothetical protein